MIPVVRQLGEVDYHETWQKMQDFTNLRRADTADELWFLTHPAVYTLGKNGKPEHVLNPQKIPVINSDRGGQVTYHGPGQIIVYTLLDLGRSKTGVRELVTQIENSIIELLAQFKVIACARSDAPGVYVNNAKIAALGLRVRKGCSFHGLALNVDMNLAPFKQINPCGFEGLEVTQLKDQVADPAVDCVMDTGIENVSRQLQKILLKNLSYES
jgi:lipoyl(octanoyl) transferase